MINKLKLTDNNCVCVKQKLNKPLIYLRGLKVIVVFSFFRFNNEWVN